MFRNRDGDRRASVVDGASATGIAFGGDKAYAAWLRTNEQPEPQENQAATRQAGAITRLASLFSHQPSPALRSAIRFKKPD